MRIVPTDKFRQFGSIITVTTDAILARCTSSPQPPGENRVKIGNRVEKNNRVGRKKIGSVGNRNHWYFFLGLILPFSATCYGSSAIYHDAKRVN